MNIKKTFIVFVILSLLVNAVVFPFVNIGSSLAASLPVVDDFEAPLNYGLDANNLQIGFFAAQDGASGPTTFARTTTPPTPVPGSAAGNNVLQMNFAVSVWAVVIHGFENEGINQWISQDWSAYEGISFWLYGQGDGSSLFIDVIDNRNTPPRANDDAERYTIAFTDNVSGWQQIKIPFASFTRKEIGNGAPNDGFTLSEVHGWAFGVTTPGAHVYYVDDASLYGTAPVKPLKVGFSASTFSVKEGRTANIVVSGGHNLIQDDTCNPVPSDLIFSDPLLGPLSDNGGSTWTHALLPGSPALDAGDDLACPATDQRGVTRPQGSHCDIGAFEASMP